MTILSLGHSAHPYETFLGLLRLAGASVVVDVRSSPFSRWRPHFNREALAGTLPRSGVGYVAMGDRLGGRPDGHEFFREGVADYEAMAEAPAFREGIDSLLAMASEGRPVMVCSEADPTHCHRCLMVGRRLAERGCDVRHVLPDGSFTSQRDVEEDLTRSDDLFAAPETRLGDGYRAKAFRHAYRRT